MSFFKSLFGKKVSIENLATLGVDMHSHLIPAIDDGVDTLEQTLEIVKKYQALGYTKIITTPHIMAGGYNNTPEIILKGRDEVRKALQQENIDIQFEAAAEYYLDELFVQYVEDKSLLTFSDNYVLFELSYLNKPNNLDIVIFEMNSREYKPILAHPERYPYLYNGTLDEYIEIRERGVFLQLNLFSLVGAYGKGAQRIAEKMVDAEIIDFVGTDVHKPKQLLFMDKCLENKYVEKLLTSEQIKNRIL